LKYLKKIPLDKIILAKHAARMRNVADVPADLKLSIKAHGLINPIIVSPNSENEFEIIDGQKRKAAYKILNNSHPEGKFDTIDCLVCEKHDENMQQAISLAANLYTVPMPRKILTEKISQTWGRYNNFKIVEAKYGISERTVKKYVKYQRLPTLIQDKINDKKITLRTSLAVVDAMNWTAANSEEKLLEIIAEFEKLKSNKRTYKKFIKLLENDPSIKSYDDIIRHHKRSFREMKISIPEILLDELKMTKDEFVDAGILNPFQSILNVRYRRTTQMPKEFALDGLDLNDFIVESILQYFDSHGIVYDREKIVNMMRLERDKIGLTIM
jgi:ParB-like chromosome segregation protein Spo0J